VKIEITANYGHEEYTELGKVKAFGNFEPPTETDSITGIWITTFGEMKIPRTEPFVTGCFDDGTLHGIFQNRVLSFYWTEDQQHGVVSAILNEEADALIGFWGGENNSFEIWTANLTTNRIIECPEDPVVLQLNSIGETLLFNFQTSALPDTTDFETQAILAGAIKFLTDNPDKKLAIESFINSADESASEKALAELWALRVKKFFTMRGISDDRLSFRGISEARPLADTATITGKSLNQRIRLRVQ
jgi:outer membrane protein OmpA-like peptidoglycan-associated protein